MNDKIKKKTVIRKSLIKNYSIKRDDNKDKEPQWYVIKIDYKREKLVLLQFEELITKNIIIDYKKVSQLSSELIKRYRWIFVKMKLTDTHVKIIRQLKHVYGFYPSNNNIMQLKELSLSKHNLKVNTYNNIQDVQQSSISKEEPIKGQCITISGGFFDGNKGIITAVKGNIVTVDVEFANNALITTEIDIKNIRLT